MMVVGTDQSPTINLFDFPWMNANLGRLKGRECQRWDLDRDEWVNAHLDDDLEVNDSDKHDILIRMPWVTRCIGLEDALFNARAPRL